jgi:hypothetical protein
MKTVKAETEIKNKNLKENSLLPTFIYDLKLLQHNKIQLGHINKGQDGSICGLSVSRNSRNR